MGERVGYHFQGWGASRIFGGLCLLAVLWISGCAHPGGVRTEEEALRARIHARWEAIQALDFERVYEFATPAYRRTHSLEHFQNQYAAQVRRKGIEIRDIRFDPDDPALAKVGLLLEFESSGVLGPMIEGVSRVEETWMKVDGQWWYVEPR
ncbi:hypothetical protein Nhal_3677 [Nitrosococcus halophilus Nc 4]|uniref:Nuclear transport factor 2 family protein n=1 Tax=Nitrosococcus halophilus (strain Nc4) TaxID=472759 RepID=D5C2M2_NITHN|nr:hypothetical protein [Nitrosococcus halophilus]ADE16697.1 hypothetical protein Nhal_3677 [Nitrosococcus halophilus Nc 4]